MPFYFIHSFFYNITKKQTILCLEIMIIVRKLKMVKVTSKKAEQLKLAGYDISIIPEDVFYDMITEENPVIDKHLAPLEATNESDKKFYDELQFVLNEIISSYDLPKKSIHIYSNKSVKGENVGKETSRSIYIYEPDYPETKDEIHCLKTYHPNARSFVCCSHFIGCSAF